MSTMKNLTIEDIDQKVQPRIYRQDYSKSDQSIEGVKIINLSPSIEDSGDFLEVLRLDNGMVNKFTGFKLAQINRSTLISRDVKAWHLHFRQDELWFVNPGDRLLVGLWDIRKTSKTNGFSMRLIMGGGRCQLLYIPRGVAHGSANMDNKTVTMWYFTNNLFDVKNPDEHRINWNAKGADFWSPKRD